MLGSDRADIRILLTVFVAWSCGVGTAQSWAGACPEVVGPTQESTDGLSGGPCGSSDKAQTFTVTEAGRVLAVEFYGCGSTVGQPLPHQVLIADLRPVLNGVPVESNSSAFSRVEIPRSWFRSDLCIWRRIDFGDQGPLVEPGTVLALVLRVNDNFCIGWRGDYELVPGDAYAGGRFYVRQTGGTWFTPDDQPDTIFGPTHRDYAFRVITCEPAVPAILMTWGRLKAHYD